MSSSDATIKARNARWVLPTTALLLMAIRIPLQSPWIDEAAIVNCGARVWGIGSPSPNNQILYWLGSLFSFLFYAALPGGMGARWFSWLGAIFLLAMWELWARQNRVLPLHRSTLAAALLFLPVITFEGSNGRLDLWAIGWAFAAFTSYQTRSYPPRIQLLLTGVLAGISVAFWFTGLITLLLLPFLALSNAPSVGRFFKDRLQELPLLLCGFALPFALMAIFRFDHMAESLQNLALMIVSRLEIGTSEISSGRFNLNPSLTQSLIPAAFIWLISWGVRFRGRLGNRFKWLTEAGAVVGVFILVVVSHFYHGRCVYWLPIPFAFVALNFNAMPKAFRNAMIISIAVLGFGYSGYKLPGLAKRALRPVNPTIQLNNRLDAWHVEAGDLIFCCGDYHLRCYFTPAPVEGFNGTFEIAKLPSATHVFIDTPRCPAAPDASKLQALGFERWAPSSPEEFALLDGNPETIPEVWIRKTLGTP